MEIVLFIGLVCLIGYSFTSKAHNAGKGESSSKGNSSTSAPKSSEPKE